MRGDGKQSERKQGGRQASPPEPRSGGLSSAELCVGGHTPNGGSVCCVCCVYCVCCVCWCVLVCAERAGMCCTCWSVLRVLECAGCGAGRAGQHTVQPSVCPHRCSLLSPRY